MTEIYSKGSGRQPYISKKEIQTMLKNMKKIPLIKKQADVYQQKESQEAEKLLEQAIKDNINI